uniref:hypothetical protein n=1 Tax=Streptomyces lunaelactis TaxID=1535768 RepID=UPI0020C78C1E|nr:hypothetical protein [Streptomyces lunaelactis]
MPEPEKVFELVARQTQISEIVVSGDLIFGSATVGNFGEVCTMTRTAPLDEFDLQCAGSLTLAQGQITFQGQFTVTGAGPGDINFAITGGTGSYKTARGFIHAANVSDTDTQLTVHLIR